MSTLRVGSRRRVTPHKTSFSEIFQWTINIRAMACHVHIFQLQGARHAKKLPRTNHSGTPPHLRPFVLDAIEANGHFPPGAAEPEVAGFWFVAFISGAI